jgi:hypothetical protein
VGNGVPVGFPTENLTSATTASRSLDYIGTVRGRLGFEATPVLSLYATGGLAYGGVKSSTTIAQSDTGICRGMSRQPMPELDHSPKLAPAGQPAAVWNGCSPGSGARKPSICITT